LGEIIHFPIWWVVDRGSLRDTLTHPQPRPVYLGRGFLGRVVWCARKIPQASPIHHPLIAGEMVEIFENLIANIFTSINWIALSFSQCVPIIVYYKCVKFQCQRANRLARVIFLSFNYRHKTLC
jgi:hypothetical protein